MKTFFDTHCIHHTTLEERHAVIDVFLQLFPYADCEYWGDQWSPRNWPYMNYNTRTATCNLHQGCVTGKAFVSAQEFIDLFHADDNEEDMSQIFALV